MDMSRIRQNMFRLLGFQKVRGHTFYEKALVPKSVVVDLGACRGDFSKYIASNYGCSVFAVEASPALFAEIEERPLIRKYNYAIADNDGVATFFESTLETAGNIIGTKPNSSGNTVEIKAMTLSSFLAEIGITEIDLLKIDIEGAEIQLFDTIQDEDILCAKQLTIEFHDSVTYPNVSTEDVKRIIKKIVSMGFDGIAMGHKNYDWLFLNKEKLCLPLHTNLYLHLWKLLWRFIRSREFKQ